LWVTTIGCGLLSAVLVNDAVCLMATPLVVAVVRQRGLALRPFLFAVAAGSNAGSALTLAGNPQNMLVARLSGLNYAAYLGRAALPVAAALIVTAGFLHLAFARRLDGEKPETPSDAPPRRRALLIGSLLATLGVIVANLAGVPMAWSALGGSAVVLVAAGERAEGLLARVDWGVIIFFAGLFIAVAAFDKTGLPAEVLAKVGVPSRLVLVAVLLIGSQVVSNVPLILLLAPWIRRFGHSDDAWGVTALVTTLAGNLTLLGSVANIIVLERARARVGFFDHLKIGAPLTLASTAAALALWWLTG
jgi:Na+/H+ antiporter NhaD/arsenite permease-like protein